MAAGFKINKDVGDPKRLVTLDTRIVSAEVLEISR
jgi:hypothetical protein